jgi:hypothetical protein
MKLRLGFVSNSSSASFLITWKVFGDEDYSVEEAVSSVMSYDAYEEEVKKSTIKKDHNTFQSYFSTCMLNCPADIGNDATALYFSLAMQKNKFEIIDAILDED